MDGATHVAFAHRGLGGGVVDQLEEEPASAAIDDTDAMFSRRRCCCCCFWVPRCGTGRSAAQAGSSWARIGDGVALEAAGPWWQRALMKVREWSEIAAGPRWKTFIRRFNRGNRAGGGGRAGKFQYDPLSYALNFDEGHGEEGNDEVDHGYRNFSARFVLPPSEVRSSMDLGGRDVPPLFSAA